MRLITAWSDVLNQNLTLRIVILLLSGCTFLFAVTTLKLSLRDPLIIERECFSAVRPKGQAKHTAAEIDSFVRVALAKRFDSDALDSVAYLSSQEKAFRDREQGELAKKSMTQRAIVNSVKIAGSTLTVDSDRLLGVGNIKSVVPFPLIVHIATTSRSPANPYGLVIERVKASTLEEKTNEKK